MGKIFVAAALGATVALTAFSGIANAQSGRQLPGRYFDPAYEAPPLTVRKRAFTDSGTQVPVGYENDYVIEQTTLNQPTYSTFRPDQFGQDVLPGRFGGIGNGF